MNNVDLSSRFQATFVVQPRSVPRKIVRLYVESTLLQILYGNIPHQLGLLTAVSHQSIPRQDALPRQKWTDDSESTKN